MGEAPTTYPNLSVQTRFRLKKINENKDLLAGEKYKSEIHLKQ